MKISTSLARRMLVILRERLQAGGDCSLAVYSGAVPLDADAPVSNAAFLGYFDAAGYAIYLAEPTDNTLGIATGATWTCNPVADGTATYFRLLWRYNDAGGQAGYDTAPVARLQGTIGTSGADLIMADPVFVSGTPKEIKNFRLTLPLVS